MTNQMEHIEKVIVDMQQKGSTKDEWEVTLLSSIAVSLATIADKETKVSSWSVDDSDGSYSCKKCGCVIYANDILDGEPHYCPNCGSHMKGE